jgi:hypothetical protein
MISCRTCSSPALRGLARFGRFLEPAVRQVVALTEKEPIRRSGAEVLAEIH